MMTITNRTHFTPIEVRILFHCDKTLNVIFLMCITTLVSNVTQIFLFIVIRFLNIIILAYVTMQTSNVT
jgi:hypothetical protein